MKSGRGFGLIEIIVTLLIISFLCFQAVKAYFKKPVFDKKTSEALSEQGIDTTSRSTIVDSTRAKVNELNSMIEKLSKDAQDME